jgi:Protein of unknown function (DUF3987)/Bifunctional DNA primase/polymerase, N-terminal
MTPTEFRLRLLRAGYSPLPLFGKAPSMMKNWQSKYDTNPAEVEMWERQWPDARNTGVLTRITPGFDIDITIEDAAVAVEDMVRTRFENGACPVRIGKPPKRAILFHTDKPFQKLTRVFIALDGSEQRIEFLGDGQQLVVHGIHPETQRLYTWHGGEPGEIPAEDLTCITEAEAKQLVADAGDLLITQFGYRDKEEPKRKGNGAATDDETPAPWGYYLDNVIDHDVLIKHVDALIAAGMNPFAVNNYVREQIERAPTDDVERKNRRFSELPGMVESGAERIAEANKTPPARPVDLWGVFSPPALPTGLLPKAVENYARAQAAIMGADPAGLAVGALVVAGAAIKDSISLQVKERSSGWTEEARIWVGLIGEPSTKKSPIIREVERPLRKIDVELFRKYMAAMAQYNALDKDERKGVEPPPQVRVRLEDTTIEAAQEVLKDSYGGVLLLQDELSGFFGSMDKYNSHRGAAKDRGFWLQAWNGGSYAINRIGRGPGLVQNLSVSLLGGIQPDLIRKLASDAHDDGMLQRMFPIILRPATLGSDEPIPTEADDYARVIDKLYQLTPTSISFWGSSGSQTRLVFDAGAQTVRQDLERKHLELAKLETINKKLAAHIGKYDGLFARLCVIWHCVENCFDQSVPRLIPAKTAQRVADFLHTFLLPHAVAFYGNILGLADDHDRLASVAGYILARKLERVTNRDIARGDRSMRRLTKRETEDVFEQLEALGWLTRQRGGRPSDPLHWAVNSECHRLFAKRAEAEAARRSEARDLIRGLLNDTP